MAFRVPAMPLVCNIWRIGNYNFFVDPQVLPPDLVVACNLAPGHRSNPTQPYDPTIGGFIDGRFYSYLLLPKGTDIRFAFGNISQLADAVECPAGSGRYYIVIWVEDVAKGFANEYRRAELEWARIPAPPLP